MTPAWAVISPDGQLAWYSLSQTGEVKAIVSGDYPDALDSAFISGSLRLLASDIALIMPEHYAPNPVARLVISALSDGRITQPWRGHVALVQYDQDPVTREWLWPAEMSARWRQRIQEVIGQ